MTSCRQHNVLSSVPNSTPPTHHQHLFYIFSAELWKNTCTKLVQLERSRLLTVQLGRESMNTIQKPMIHVATKAATQMSPIKFFRQCQNWSQTQSNYRKAVVTLYSLLWVTACLNLHFSDGVSTNTFSGKRSNLAHSCCYFVHSSWYVLQTSLLFYFIKLLQEIVQRLFSFRSAPNFQRPWSAHKKISHLGPRVELHSCCWNIY